MDIATFCQRQVITIAADAPLRDAARLMRERHVGALVVTDPAEAQRVLGVVTDRDLAIEVLSREPDGAALSVGEIASRKPAAVPGTASVNDAVAAMERSGVRRLLVMDTQREVIGFLSADDLIDAIAIELSGLAAALRTGISREEAKLAAAAHESRSLLLPPGPGVH